MSNKLVLKMSEIPETLSTVNQRQQPRATNTSDEDELHPPVIVDIGSRFTKVGLAAVDAQRADVKVFPSFVAVPKNRFLLIGINIPSAFVGHQAIEKSHIRGVYRLCKFFRPVDRGIISDWEMFEKIWSHAFYSVLCTDPSEQLVLILEPPLTSLDQRQRTTTLLFETFNTMALYFLLSGTAVVMASGQETGVAVSIGAHLTHVVPVYEGFPVPHGITRMSFGGEDLSTLLFNALRNKGSSIIYTKDWEELEKIKKEHAWIRTSTAKSAPSDSTVFQVAGEDVDFGDLLHSVQEVLFKSDEVSTNRPALQEMVHEAILACESDLHATLAANLVLAGEPTTTPGLGDRLVEELRALTAAPWMSNVKVCPKKLGGSASLLGGQYLASNLDRSAWIWSEEYKEHGPKVCLRCRH